jgi:hypothetical protein
VGTRHWGDLLGRALNLSFSSPKRLFGLLLVLQNESRSAVVCGTSEAKHGGAVLRQPLSGGGFPAGVSDGFVSRSDTAAADRYRGSAATPLLDLLDALAHTADEHINGFLGLGIEGLHAA